MEYTFKAKTVVTGEWIYFTLRDLAEGTFKAQFIWDTVCEVNVMIENRIIDGIFKSLAETTGTGFAKASDVTKDKLKLAWGIIIREAMKEHVGPGYTSMIREAFAKLEECDAKNRIFEMCEVIDNLNERRRNDRTRT